MKPRIDGTVNPLLVAGAALALFGGSLALPEFGVMDWSVLWHYWMLLLVLVG